MPNDSSDMMAIDALLADHEQMLPDAPSPEPIGEGVVVPLDELHPFPGHPFRVVMDAAMEALVESIRKNGVLNRIIIRPRREGGFEIVAGHRRTEASRIAGLTFIPADLRRDMDDDAATIAMIETNLKQRPKLLPSERAHAYRMMRDALAHRGVAVAPEAGSRQHTKDEIAACYGESARQVARFIQNEMVASLAERADEVSRGNADPRQDNMLKITNDGRLLALDARLIDSALPDNPGSKINACVREVLRIHKEGEEDG
jgi:ParB/RepB/Spo0J family partition protein